MANRFTAGNKAISECDRCGIRVKLKDLKNLVIKTKQVSIKVCNECWEEDHPQLQLGMYPVADPQAVRDPRPDFAGYAQSRSNIVPVQNFLNSEEYTSAGGEVGTVTLILPPPYLFLDTFTGPSVPLGSHTPDYGAPWENVPFFDPGLVYLELDGSGFLRPVPIYDVGVARVPISLGVAGTLFTVDWQIPTSPINQQGFTFELTENVLLSPANVFFTIVYTTASGWQWGLFDNGGIATFGNLFSPSVGVGTFTLLTNGSTRTLKYGTTVLYSSTSSTSIIEGSFWAQIGPQYTGKVSRIMVEKT